MRTAILLIAHGSREAKANDDLVTLAAELREAGPYTIVEPAFLELAEPTIVVAGGRCAAAGAERVVLVPYFLSAGVHVTRDLQNYRESLGRAFPAIEFVLAGPLGPHALLRDIVLQRANEAK
jgi:sirohydrochlorin ferrochelatase